MLAMHYAVDLDGEEQLDRVRQRVAERGPVFDAVPGLVAKAFLLDPADPCYALYYLWRDADAMRVFLQGPLFAALAEAYGRPTVTTYVTPAMRFPFRHGDIVRERFHVDSEAPEGIVFFDPRTGESVALNALNAQHGRAYEVIYLAAQGQSLID